MKCCLCEKLDHAFWILNYFQFVDGKILIFRAFNLVHKCTFDQISLIIAVFLRYFHFLFQSIHLLNYFVFILIITLGLSSFFELDSFYSNKIFFYFLKYFAVFQIRFLRKQIMKVCYIHRTSFSCRYNLTFHFLRFTCIF